MTYHKSIIFHNLCHGPGSVTRGSCVTFEFNEYYEFYLSFLIIYGCGVICSWFLVSPVCVVVSVLLPHQAWRVPALEPATPAIITHLLPICLIKEPYLREQWSSSLCGIVELEIQLVLSSYSRIFDYVLVGMVNVFSWPVDGTVLILASLVSRVITETCEGSSPLLNTVTEGDKTLPRIMDRNHGMGNWESTHCGLLALFSV